MGRPSLGASQANVRFGWQAGAGGSGGGGARREREVVTQLWHYHVPGGVRAPTAPRSAVREVLLRAALQLGPPLPRSVRAAGLVDQALASPSPAEPVSLEDACKLLQAILACLHEGESDGEVRDDGGQALRVEGVLPDCGIEAWNRQRVHARGSTALAGPVLVSAGSVRTAQAQGARTTDQTKFKKAHGAANSPSIGSMRGAAILRGRTVSPQRSKGDFSSALAMSPLPPPPTRAALESAGAELRAGLCSRRRSYGALVCEVRRLRKEESASSGNKDGDLVEGSSAHLELEVDLERRIDKVHTSAKTAERQLRELAVLRKESDTHSQRALQALRECTDTREKLRQASQECAELTRKAKMEQLRATMLREAFEQEQTRVGASLERAEAHVSDLIAATDSARRAEAEEQSIARECVCALSEVYTAQANDEMAVEARVVELRRGLDAATAELAVNQQQAAAPPEAGAAAITATALYAKAEAERQAAATQLGEALRKCQSVQRVARRHAAQEAGVRSELEAVRAASRAVDAQLLAAVANTPDGSAAPGHQGGGAPQTATAAARGLGRLIKLRPHLRLEATAEAVLQAAEERIAGELEEARRGKASADELLAQRRKHSLNAGRARQCTSNLSAELERLRAELNTFASPGPVPTPVDNEQMLNLEAAALQRRLGAALAAERRSSCRLQELLHSAGAGSGRVGGGAAEATLSVEAAAAEYRRRSRQEGRDARLEAKVAQQSAALERCQAGLLHAEGVLESLSKQQLRVASPAAAAAVAEAPPVAAAAEEPGADTLGGARDGELASLEAQLKILRDENDAKDAEIELLNRLAWKAATADGGGGGHEGAGVMASAVAAVSG